MIRPLNPAHAANLRHAKKVSAKESRMKFFLVLFMLGQSVFAAPSLLSATEIQKKLVFAQQINIEKLKDAAGNVIAVRQDRMSEVIAKKMIKNKIIQLKLLFMPRHNCKDSTAFSRATKDTADSIS